MNRSATGRGHDGLRASLPRQFQERLGGARRLRAGRRNPAQRDEDRRLLPRIRRRALRRFRAAALRAQERDRRARPDEFQARRRRTEGRSSSAASRRRPDTCRSTSARSATNAASPRPRMATTSPRPTNGSSSRVWLRSRRKYGAKSKARGRAHSLRSDVVRYRQVLHRRSLGRSAIGRAPAG